MKFVVLIVTDAVLQNNENITGIRWYSLVALKRRPDKSEIIGSNPITTTKNMAERPEISVIKFIVDADKIIKELKSMFPDYRSALDDLQIAAVMLKNSSDTFERFTAKLKELDTLCNGETQKH